MTRIEIAAKPQIVKPPNVMGSFLEVPLNETPDPQWQRHFKAPVEHFRFEEGLLRIPLTSQARANLGILMERLSAAIQQANADREAEVARHGRDMEKHREIAERERTKMAADLDGWWDRERSAA